MDVQHILMKLPYEAPFLFVDSIMEINEQSVKGSYTFKENEYFYKGHFSGNPVTPGVILTECCAQIGLVALGIYLLDKENYNLTPPQIAMSSSEMKFFLPVYPSEKVIVSSQKLYFRFQKLKCSVKMYNSEGDLVCSGTLSGMLKNNMK